MPTVSSVNVNGIRAAAAKGLSTWLAGTAADVVCLQETRAQLEEIPPELLDGWHLSYASCGTRGRNGVGILTREAPEAVRAGIGAPEFEDAGRYLEVDLSGVTVGSLYLPNGTVGTPKQDAKDRFLALFADHLAERRAKSAVEDREVLVCGDWNIAPAEADIRNWRGNVKNSGSLPHERSGSRTCARPGGWTSSGRCTRASTGRTRGGPIGGGRSTTTPAGASTTTSRLPGWRGVRSPPWSSAPRATPNAGRTMRR